MDNQDRGVGAVEDKVDGLKFFFPESNAAHPGQLPLIGGGSVAESSPKLNRSGPPIELTGAHVVTDAAYPRQYRRQYPLRVGRRRRQEVRLHTIGILTIDFVTATAIAAGSLGRRLLASSHRAGRYAGDLLRSRDPIGAARSTERAVALERLTGNRAGIRGFSPASAAAWVQAHLPTRLPRWNAMSFVGGVLLGALAVLWFGVRSPADSPPPAPQLRSTSSPPATPSSTAALPTTVIQEPVKADAAPPPRPSSTTGPSGLRAASGYRGGLRIDSQPTGASVFVNNQRVGQTPIALQSLPVGSRAVRLELNGYAPWSRSVRIVADQSATVSARLEAAR